MDKWDQIPPFLFGIKYPNMYFVPFVIQLVGNFQTEASQRKQESDQAVTKLSSVRKLIAKLLKSINEVGDLFKEKIHQTLSGSHKNECC